MVVNVTSYVPLVLKLATNIWHTHPFARRWGTEEDLKQEALVVLMEAARDGRFDATRGCFSTFLSIRLRQHLWRICMHGGVVATPCNSEREGRYNESFRRARIVAALGIDMADHRREPSADERLDVRDALAQLSDADRELLLACYYEHREQAALAPELGITRQGVHFRVKQAKKRLAKKLTEYA